MSSVLKKADKLNLSLSGNLKSANHMPIYLFNGVVNVITLCVSSISNSLYMIICIYDMTAKLCW